MLYETFFSFFSLLSIIHLGIKLPRFLFSGGKTHVVNDQMSLKAGCLFTWTVEPSILIPNLLIASGVNM